MAHFQRGRRRPTDDSVPILGSNIQIKPDHLKKMNETKKKVKKQKPVKIIAEESTKSFLSGKIIILNITIVEPRKF